MFWHNRDLRHTLQYVGIALVCCLLLLWTKPVFAAGTIVLDGQFADWDGHAHVDDPQGDANATGTDLAAFYFATNPDDETAYFMAERYRGGSNPVTYRLRVDTDDDGSYDDVSDRVIEVNYKPNQRDSRVSVTVYDGAGGWIADVADRVDWGESKSEGGRLVEWGVAFADLGIAPFQTISMQLDTASGAGGGSRSDTSSEVQWSPAHALGVPLLIGLLLVGSVWFAFRRSRRE